MIFAPRDPTRCRVPQRKRPPCITLREFAESVGVGYHSLRGCLNLTPRSTRPKPALANSMNYSGVTHKVNWYVKKDLVEWWTQRQNNKLQKGIISETNMGLQ